MGRQERRNKGNEKSEQAHSKPSSAISAATSFKRYNWILLALALLAALIVYWPSTAEHPGLSYLGAGWFYDDSDYIINDPRIDHLELFLPSHWSSPPPPLDSHGGPALVLPGYNNPLITDRYLWHLSFALERALYGPDNPLAAHETNLFLHLACVGALFLALSRLGKLYGSAEIGALSLPDSRQDIWQLLPGIAALIFAVHPWGSEPVCYVSARNGSMGTLCVLMGLTAWTEALLSARVWKKILCVLAAAFCALAAYGCKENFITAPAGYILAVLPLLSRRMWHWSRAGTVGILAGTVMLVLVIGRIGILYSDRARGLFAQTLAGQGWGYFLEIQNPLVLMTLGDQIPARRVSLESNHPGWALWACWVALTVNTSILCFSIWKSVRWPILLGVVWFYLHLLPTNSILPRQDFLAARNVYLPVAGTATAMAGALLWLWQYLERRASTSELSAGAGVRRDSKPLWGMLIVCAGLWLYWAGTSWVWAEGFNPPEYKVWAYSAKVAPDHASVRLNLAAALYSSNSPHPPGPDELAAADKEFQAALIAEDSPTMKYYDPRHQNLRRALALRYLGTVRRLQGRDRDAAEFFKRSWTLLPMPATWVPWAQTCLKGGDSLHTQLDYMVREGEREWPQGWWPGVVRALAYNDTAGLEAAEQAADSVQPEFRVLQAEALYRLVQSPSGRSRAEDLLRRLQGLGVPQAELEKLAARLQGQ